MKRRAARALSCFLLPCAVACTSVPAGGPPARCSRANVAAPALLRPPPIDSAAFRQTPEPLTVERHWILTLYTWLHARDYRSFRVDFPGTDGTPGVAHLLLPRGQGPHPAVLVFPILAGSHVVSEGLAKALVHRGYAVLRVERRPIFSDEDPARDFERPTEQLRSALRDGRRLLDWLETHPSIDSQRLATAGVSLGGILAAALMGIDDRVQAGFFISAGGGLPELLYDSTERPVRAFRDRILQSLPDPSRTQFIERARSLTRLLDPLTYAPGVDPSRVLLVSGRFDRVVPPERTEALWRAFGKPAWIRFPAGHYQLFPFFWWAIGRGADHLDRVLRAPGPPRLRTAVPASPSPSGDARGGGALGVDDEAEILEQAPDAVAPVRSRREGSLVVVDR